ncbi:MAG: hypothetical protein QM754_09485 [Tepidisphaeraceae bacterium]
MVPASVSTPLGNDTIDGVTGPSYGNWNYLRVTGPGNNNVFSVVRGLLGRYTKTDKVFYCPSMNEYSDVAGLLKLDPLQPATTYAMHQDPPKKITLVRSPSDTVWVADAIVADPTTGALALTPHLRRGSLGAYGGDTFHGRHLGKGSAGFHDGHAEAMIAQPRPYSSYAGTSQQAYAVMQKQHIGPMTPTGFTAAMLGSSSTYAQGFYDTYDYYFWYDKNAKQ